METANVADSEGFDAMHEDRRKSDLNWQLLQELRASAAKLWDGGATLTEGLQHSLSSMTHSIVSEISAIESAPIPGGEKKAAIEALIAEGNAAAISQNSVAAAEFTAALSAHQALAQSLPLHRSTANPTPSQPTLWLRGHRRAVTGPATPRAPPTEGRRGARWRNYRLQYCFVGAIRASASVAAGKMRPTIEPNEAAPAPAMLTP